MKKAKIIEGDKMPNALVPREKINGFISRIDVASGQANGRSREDVLRMPEPALGKLVGKIFQKHLGLMEEVRDALHAANLGKRAEMDERLNHTSRMHARVLSNGLTKAGLNEAFDRHLEDYAWLKKHLESLTTATT